MTKNYSKSFLKFIISLYSERENVCSVLSSDINQENLNS